MMLDLRNVTLGLGEQHPESDISHMNQVPQLIVNLESDSAGVSKPPGLFGSSEDPAASTVTPQPRLVDLELTPGRPRISLQDMISTSVALKSNVDVEFLRPTQSRPSGLFPSSKTSISLPLETETSFLLHPESNNGQGESISSHVAQVISGLQREVLLLKNELNFELWLSRENVRHIGRLYQDRILSKTAEAERQGLVRVLTLSIVDCLNSIDIAVN